MATTWTTPKTFTPSLLTASDMNTYVRDNTQHLYDLFYDDWVDWTPALQAFTTSPTLGSSSVTVGRYMNAGNLVIGWGLITFGTAGVAAGSGTYFVTLPVAPKSTSYAVLGTAHLLDNSTTTNSFSHLWATTWPTAASMRLTSGTTANVTNAAPWTWAASDSIRYEFMYEKD